MRKILLVTLIVLLVAGFAYAQDNDGHFRGRLGWVDAGDIDSDIGFGVDYLKANHLFGFDYSMHEQSDTEGDVGEEGIGPAAIDFEGAARVNFDVDMMSFSYTYVKRPTDDADMTRDSYYGAGVGYYDADVDATACDGAGDITGRESQSESSIGFHVLGGMEFGDPDDYGRKPWFGELRYVFGTDFDDLEADVDGIRLFLGHSF